MTSAIKTTLKIIGGLVALVVFSLAIMVVIFLNSDPNQYKDMLAERVKERTGATIDIKGDFDLTVFPIPGVVMNKVDFVFPGTNGTSYLAKAESLKINFRLLSLFTTEYDINHFSGKGVELTVQQKGKEPQRFQFDMASGALTRTCCSIEITDLNLKSKGSTLKGYVNAQIDLPKPLVTGKLKLSDYQPNAFMPNGKKVPSSSKLIPATPLPFDLIRQVDFDLLVNLSNIPVGADAIQSGKFHLATKDNEAHLNPISLEMWQSELVGDIVLTPLPKGQGGAKINLSLKNGSFQSVLGDSDKVSGGKFDITLQGKGTGTTLRSVLSRFDGNALWVLRDATLKNTKIKSDVTDAMLGFLNPFSKGSADTTVECVVMRYEIKNGKAFAINHIAAETRKLEVLGSGQIDLGTEALDMEFSLRPKKGIDIGIGNFDDYIRLAGTLKEPKVVADPKGILKEGLNIFGAVASGGISILAKQVFNSLDGGSPCATVLEDKK